MPNTRSTPAELALEAMAKMNGTPVEIEPTRHPIGDKEQKAANAATIPAASAPSPSAATAMIPVNASSPTPQPAPANDDANADPEAQKAVTAWKKAAANAIMVQWNAYRESKRDELGVGQVIVKFALDAQGQVSDLQVLSNTGKPTAATYALHSIQETVIPPIPPERLARMGKGERVAIQLDFTIVSTQ